MRIHYFVLLVAAVVVASEHTTAATTGLKMTTPDRISKRALRTGTTTTQDDEERAFLVPESVSTWFAGAAPKLLLKLLMTDEQLQKLAKSGTTSDDVFSALRLDDGLDDLLSNPNLKTFATYLRMTNTKEPDIALIRTITDKYGDKTVAEFLLQAKSNKNTKELAENLQASQFLKWMKDKKSDETIMEMFDISTKTWYKNPYHPIWDDYVAAKAYVASISK